MYHDELHHLGRPHFHARYGGDEASIDTETWRSSLAGCRRGPFDLSSNGRVSTEPSCERTGTVPAVTSRFSRSIRLGRSSTMTAMRSTPLLTEAKPLGGYRIRVRFEDGTSGEVDLSYLLDYGGVFAPLRDPGYFRQLRADPEAGTIVWPNEADIAPEALYAQAQGRTAATA